MKIKVNEDLFLNISEGNSKMDAIPSFSLPPVITCRPDAPCRKECYQIKISRLRKVVLNTYQQNYELLNRGMFDTVQSLIGLYLKLTNSKYFRWNVSGDFNLRGYFNMQIRVAEENPQVQFLQFTKCYEYAKRKRPKNFHLILSAWRDELTPPVNQPVQQIIDSIDDIEDKSLICQGGCSTCLKCFYAKKDFRVYFLKH